MFNFKKEYGIYDKRNGYLTNKTNIGYTYNAQIANKYTIKQAIRTVKRKKDCNRFDIVQIVSKKTTV